MDPISSAIIAAISTGAVTGVTKLGQNVVLDAYTALKTAIQKRFGAESKLIKSVSELEDEPGFEPHRAALAERVVQSKADKDTDLTELAQKLLDILSKGTGPTVHQEAGDEAIQVGRDNYGGIQR